MGKRVVMLDVVFYVVFPIVLWHALRGPVGEYGAMLICTVPGAVYTVYRFWVSHRVQWFGAFLLANLAVSTLLNVFAGSALQMLWNDVSYSIVLSVLFLGTVIVKRPLMLYFSLDFVEMQGAPRAAMKKRFFEGDVFPLFQWITVGFAVRDGLLAAIKAYLIVRYGVEAFDRAIVVREIVSWGITILCIFGFARISKIISERENRHHLV
ncbi:VC0807 family protein [Geobacillus sp. YF-1]|uniref:VC0807 family protein n=1 Tax=Geobacillus sp. YF-1 TaxID=3457480 RepID=UPI00404601BA